MNVAFQKDVGAHVQAHTLMQPRSFTSTNDASTNAGTIFDRRTDSAGTYESVTIVVPVTQTFASSGKTATFKLKVQDSATTDSTAFADFAGNDDTTAWSVVLTATTLTTVAQSDIIKADVRLASANRYVRVTLLPTLTSTAGNLAYLGGVVGVFGGADTLPTT
jgi:hypothetical protein